MATRASPIGRVPDQRCLVGKLPKATFDDFIKVSEIRPLDMKLYNLLCAPL